MKNRSIFIALMLIPSLPLCAQLEKHIPSKIVLRKSTFGTYGYKEVGKDSWDFIPRYKYAESMKYRESCAAFSIDGEKYGIINAQQWIVANPIFDRPPHDISYGIAIIDTDNGQQLVNFDGQQLSPEVYKIFRYETTFAIQRTKEEGWQFVDAGFNPISSDSYKSITLNELQCDSVSANLALTESKDGLKGLYYFNGKPILNCYYKEIVPLSKIYNSYHVVFYKAVNKSSVRVDNIQPFVLVKNINGSYAVVDYLSKYNIAVKGKDEWSAVKNLSKIFKKQIAPLCTDERKVDYRNLLLRIEQVNDSLTNVNVKSLGGQDYFDCMFKYKNSYKEIEEFVEKTTTRTRSKKAKSKRENPQKYFRFVSGYGSEAKEDPRVFTKLENIGSINIGTERGTKGVCVYDFQGLKIGNRKPYEEVDIWAYIDEVPWLKFKENGKWGIMTIAGDIVQDAIFDDLGSTYKDLCEAYADNRLYLLNSKTGRLVNNNSYDTDYCHINKGSATVRRNGYEVNVYTDGHEDPSVAKIEFGKFYDYIESNPDAYTAEEKLKKYDEIINMCSTGDNDIIGACYNNMGVIFHDAGDNNTALRLYYKAKKYGNQTAASNIASIESQLKQERKATWGQVLNGIGNILGSVYGYTSNDLSNNVDAYSGSSSNDYSSTGGGSSASTYQSIYDRWERTAKSAYESLTRAGTRTKQNGQDVSGSNNGYWKSQNYVSLKQNLREAQAEMRKTRQEARREGININQSNYETVTVSY